MGTELRFLKQLNVEGFKDSVEAQFWHGRALEMSLAFLPGDSPFVKHIIHSYSKHHSPSSQSIPEEYEMSPNIKILKPLNGVHFSKINPMIQDWDYIYEDKYKTSGNSKISPEFAQNMVKHRKNAMIKISPLDMPNNDYFKFIDDRMIEIGIKEEPNGKIAEINNLENTKSAKAAHTVHSYTTIIPTRDQEVQITPEAKPTKVYIDRSCSAKWLTTRVIKPKPKPTTEIGTNTTELNHQQKYSPKGSESSSANTTNNVMGDLTKNSRLFKKYNSNRFNTINASGGFLNSSYTPSHTNSNTNSRKHTSRHSIDLGKQSLLQKKYKDSLNNYPQKRLTPHTYETIERPNSVTGSIKLRKSHDFNNFPGKNSSLDMYALKQAKLKSGSRYSNHGSDK
jgi:hypothetical protein